MLIKDLFILIQIAFSKFDKIFFFLSSSNINAIDLTKLMRMF